MEYLLILFVALTVISCLSIAFLFLAKNQKTKDIFFYLLAILGMLVAFMSATSLPTNFIMEMIIAWSFGVLSIIAIIIKVKNPQNDKIAKYLVTASVVIGIIDLFFF